MNRYTLYINDKRQYIAMSLDGLLRYAEGFYDVSDDISKEIKSIFNNEYAEVDILYRENILNLKFIKDYVVI